jgi:hypothetical protein
MDGWRDVRGIIIIGRPQPAPSAIEAMAEVLTRHPPATIAGDWYEKFPGVLNMHGTGEGPEVFYQKGDAGEIINGTDRHPDPIVEAIRWRICEAELIQTIGRGRGVNRTAQTPLQIDLMTNILLSFATDEAELFEDFEPTLCNLMAVRGVVVPDTNAKGACPMIAAILPDVFAKDQAARDKSKARSQGNNRIGIIYGYSPVSGFTFGRARLSCARYAVPVLLRSMEDLRRIDPGASFKPDAPSAAAAAKLHACRAGPAIGPESQPAIGAPPPLYRGAD